MTPGVGDILAGRYVVESVLGRGGMGIVVAARHAQLGQRYAIKIMLPSLAFKPEHTTRFVREARAAAALKSEHVARVHDVGKLEDESPYMVMELLEGRTLDALVVERGPLPIVEAVGYLLEACEAIAEAHALGIVHRDIKPSNLFLADMPGGTSRVKVLDFGISKTSNVDPTQGDISTLTETDATLGSPQYMSPEQLRSPKSVDQRTDLWALGIVLHKLLTGRLAFEAESLGAHLSMIIADPPIPLRQRRPDAPVELEAIILKCLEKDVGARYQNVGQLARALVPLGPPSAAESLRRIVSVLGEPGETPAPASSAKQAVVPDVNTMSAWTPADREKKAPGSRTLVVGLAVAAVALTAVAFGARTWFAAPAVVVTAAPMPSEPAIAATQAAAAAPAASAPPAATAESATVRIQLDIDPPGAVLEVDGRPAQSPVVLPRGDALHRIVVRAPGYATHSADIAALADTTLKVALTRLGGRAPGGAAPQATGSPGAPPPATSPPARSKGPMETTL